nr:NDR1/HIN1-like protein 1 [Ipomoea batatas]
MSTKECTHHKQKRKKLIRQCCAGLLIFLFVVLLTILITWAILQPKKPRFYLRDATIFNFNVSAPNIFSTTIQITVESRNPNDNIGIYYDRLAVFAVYRDQQITFATAIPPVYQGHKDDNLWSPFVYGNNVPIAPFFGPMLSAAQDAGGVEIMFRLDGRVRWKVGTLITSRYHIHVRCPAYIPFGNVPGPGGILVGNAVKYQFVQRCEFDFSAANNTLLYNLALNMSIRNPNKRIGIYYDVIEARALYGGQRFAAVNLDPFFQPTKNTSDLRAVIKGQNLVPLGDGEKSDYSAQKNNGAYRIDLKLFLKIRLKFWFIKSKKIKPTIDCALDNVPLRSNSVHGVEKGVVSISKWQSPAAVETTSGDISGESPSPSISKKSSKLLRLLFVFLFGPFSTEEQTDSKSSFSSSLIVKRILEGPYRPPWSFNRSTSSISGDSGVDPAELWRLGVELGSILARRVSVLRQRNKKSSLEGAEKKEDD